MTRQSRRAAPAPPTMWDHGDYAALARRLEPAASWLVDLAGPGRGRPALDVAAGDGSLAGELAIAGWDVHATDSSSVMVERGRSRVPEATWVPADLTSQPYEDASFDLVGSSFGMIFAGDPHAALAETARVLRPGGRLLISAWTSTGYMASMTEVIGSFFDQAPPMQAFAWGDEATVRGFLAEHFADPVITRRSLPWAFETAREGRDFLARSSPGHLAAVAALGDRASLMLAAVEQHLAAYADQDGRVSLAADYLLIDARLG